MQICGFVGVGFSDLFDDDFWDKLFLSEIPRTESHVFLNCYVDEIRLSFRHVRGRNLVTDTDEHRTSS